MLNEDALSALLETPTPLRRIEPGFYSLAGDDGLGNAYDQGGALGFYDKVACNPVYNRIMWGYWPSVFDERCRGLLSRGRGLVLDAGCGALSFTARAYAANPGRPVVCLDASLTLLSQARKRLTRLMGRLPDNVVFLHADVLNLPFAPGAFDAVVALNLLHCVPGARALLSGLVRAATPGAMVLASTLALCGRWSDGYLRMWGRAGELVPRTREEVLGLCEDAGLNLAARMRGNMLLLEGRS